MKVTYIWEMGAWVLFGTLFLVAALWVNGLTGLDATVRVGAMVVLLLVAFLTPFYGAASYFWQGSSSDTPDDDYTAEQRRRARANADARRRGLRPMWSVDPAYEAELESEPTRRRR